MSQARQATPRTVVVTGAGGGLGRAFALGFAAQGHRVVAADIDEKGAHATVALLREDGADALAVGVDVTDRASTDALAAASAEFGGGRIDVLVNNAAIYAGLERRPFDEIDPAEWDRVMAVNLRGLFLCARAVLPTMTAQGKGKIFRSSTMAGCCVPHGNCMP